MLCVTFVKYKILQHDRTIGLIKFKVILSASIYLLFVQKYCLSLLRLKLIWVVLIGAKLKEVCRS